MSTLLQHESDLKTREAVEAELRWTPQIPSVAEIGVSVDDGVVTLTGHVSSYSQKVAAGKAALRTLGVTSIANDLTVGANPSANTDSQLATDARDALKLNSDVPKSSVDAEVRNHFVYLTGQVDWDYQRKAAQGTVQRLSGVKGVINDLTLVPRPSSSETHAKIRNALVRTANVDANRIVVTVNGTEVTLTGTVSSYAEKRQAGLAAWASPHVTAIHNDLRIVTSSGA